MPDTRIRSHLVPLKHHLPLPGFGSTLPLQRHAATVARSTSTKLLPPLDRLQMGIHTFCTAWPRPTETNRAVACTGQFHPCNGDPSTRHTLDSDRSARPMQHTDTVPFETVGDVSSPSSTETVVGAVWTLPWKTSEASAHAASGAPPIWTEVLTRAIICRGVAARRP